MEIDQTASEIKRLKTCINNLISVLALPAIWSGHEPAQILSTLLDVLLRMLRLDFVYARLSDSIGGGAPIEMVRAGQPGNSTAQPEEIGQKLNPWLTGDLHAAPLVMPNPIGEGEISIAPLRLGLQDQVGVLVAGSQRADFPMEIEMLLLRVAANQAAIGLQEARLLSEQRRVAEELDQRVVERTRQLTAVNEELRKEIIERKRAEQRLATQYAITRALAEFDTLAAATPHLLQALGESMQWKWGALWIVDREAALLRCESIWHAPDIDAMEFDTISHETTFTLGRGLPGQVAQSAKPAWIADVTQDPNFERTPIAAKVGLRGAIAFPILLGGETLGVMEFFSRTVRQPDEEQLATLSAIGSQVGQFVERKRAEEALRKSEERWRAVFENSAIGVALADLNGRFLATNSAYQKMLGYTEEELRKLTFLDLTREDYRESNWSFITELLEGKRKQFQIEKQYWRKDGSLIWVSNNVSLVPGSESMPRFIMALSEEITARKRADEELRRSEAYLAEAQRLSHTGSWAWNVSTGEVFWSRELFRIFGLDAERTALNIDLIKKFRHPEDRPFAEQTFDTAVREKIDFEMESRIVLPDGSIRHVHTVGHPAVNDADDLVEFVGTVMDVTERKQAEEALRKSQAELAHLTRVMTLGELASSIAHEINQPLTAIVANGNGCVRWLAGDSPNLDEAREAARRIIRDGNRASDVITRIRALLRKTAIEKTQLDINQIVQEVVLLLQNEAMRNGVTLRTELASDFPPVFADRVQLQQVILNLVVNGIEATARVTDRARELLITSHRYESDKVLVAVQDSGIGIDPQNLERIFDAFYTTKSQGIGMGLAISRSIIEDHGGRLWAQPNAARGATFQFTLRWT